MALEFKLPDIGEGVAEGEIVKWLVDVGASVKEHQAIVEVMTDKATVEIPAPAAGTITKLNAKPGDVVPVGSVLFVLETAAGAAAPKSGGHGAAQATPAAPAGAAPKAGTASAAPNAGSAPAGAAPKASSAPASASPKAAAASPAPASAAAKPAAPSPAPAAGAPKEAPASPAQPAAASPNGGHGPSKAGPGGRLEFKLPDIGEGVAEGEIVKWLVDVGATVKEHQSVVEVMTDKATVEIPAPAAGKLASQNAKAGDVVPVGAVLFVLETAGATASAPARAAPASAHAAAATPAQGAPAHAAESAAAAAPAKATPAREPVHAGAAPAEARADDSRVLAVPSARRVARELGLSLSEVTGTGRNGVVRRADVEAYAKSREAAAAPAPAKHAAPSAPSTPRTPAPPVTFAPGERESRIPFRGVRRKIAEAMVRSKFTAPHFTVVEEVDVTDLVKLREQAKSFAEGSGVKVTYMPFIMKACALGLAKYPMLNAHLDEGAGEIVRYGYVNLGIAMDTDQGLIVPVVKEVQGKGILQLAAELADLAERTRAGKVKPDELKGSTFSITNAGNIGGTLATPIINYPDVAILGVHRLMKKPGVVETPQGDRIEVRQYMNFSCSVDHRLADGADGARFLVYLKKLLESPGLLAL